MYSLEDDGETSSRIQKQVLVGLAETQKHSDLLKPRPTRNLADDQPSSSLGIVAKVASVTATLPADEQNVMQGTSVGAAPEASPFFMIDEPTLVDQPTLPHLAYRADTLHPPQPTDSFPLPVQDASGKKPNPRAIAALSVVCIAVFFTAMDQTVVVTALPRMIPDLGISFTQLDHAAWIISAYLLGFVVAMPLMGRVSDIYGRRLIFLLCLTIFGIGSLLCALALPLANFFDISFLGSIGIDVSSQPLIWLVAARLIQAVGGGALVPIAMAVASDFYGDKQRGLALGIVGAVTEAGGAFGPLYGAIIVDHLGWQAIFYLNVPVVVLLFVGGCFLIPRGRRLLQGIDWLGAVLLAGALSSLSIALAQQGTSLGPVSTTSHSASNPVALLLAVAFFAAFIFTELKVRWPVVDLAHFKRSTFSAASAVSLLVGAALIIAMSDIPIYVDTVLRGSLLDSGLALLRLTVMIPVGAILGGWLCHRISCRWVGIASLLLTALGFFLMSLWPIQPSQLQITLSTLITGFGFGLVIAPIGTTAVNSLWPSQAGVGSAIVTALRMVGMTLGLSVLTSWALARFQQLAAQYHSLPPNSTPAQTFAWSQGYATHVINSLHTTYTEVFLISAVICLIALVPAFFLWGRHAPQVEPAAHAEMLYEDESTLSPFVLKQRKRKRQMTVGIALLTILLLVGGLTAEWFRENAAYGGSPFVAHTANTTSNLNIVPGARVFQIALDQSALTSVLVGQLGSQTALTDVTATPGPNNGLALTLNLHINIGGVDRVMPVEIDGQVGLDNQQNIHITVQQLKRDGVAADSNTTLTMQNALNQMLVDTVMFTLQSQFKGTKLISVYTSTTVSCAQNTEMFVLQVGSAAVPGVSTQQTPVPFCFKGPINLNQLLPQQ